MQYCFDIACDIVYDIALCDIIFIVIQMFTVCAVRRGAAMLLPAQSEPPEVLNVQPCLITNLDVQNHRG